MSDAQAPEEIQETPQTSAPEEGHAPEQTETHDWEQRYTSLRPEFDRTKQQLSQYEEFIGQLTNPETQAEALAALNLEPAEQEEDYSQYTSDPTEQLQERLERLELERAEEQANAEQEAIAQQTMQFVDQGVTHIEQEIGRQFDPEEKDLVIADAYAHPDEQGLPDVQSAYKRLEAAYQAQQKRYLQTKKNTPRVPDGKSAEEAFDLSTPEGRKAAAEAKLESLADDVER